MKTEINLIIKNYNRVYNGRPWYGDSIISNLNKIDVEKIFIKRRKKDNCIAEILAHIIGWREFVLSCLDKRYSFNLSQKDTFNWKRIDSDQKTALKSMIKRLEENQAAVIKILERSDDKLLHSMLSRKKYSIKFLLEGIIQHDIYHIGQISLLNKVINSEY